MQGLARRSRTTPQPSETCPVAASEFFNVGFRFEMGAKRGGILI